MQTTGPVFESVGLDLLLDVSFDHLEALVLEAVNGVEALVPVAGVDLLDGATVLVPVFDCAAI